VRCVVSFVDPVSRVERDQIKKENQRDERNSISATHCKTLDCSTGTVFWWLS
jgi:hypothetical protein